MNRLLMFAVLFVTACSETPVSSPGSVEAVPVVEMVWPAAPAEPRISYEFSFTGPEDLGIHPSGIKRLWNALAGTEDNSMVRPYAVSVYRTNIVVGDPGANAVHLFDRIGGKYLRIDKAGEETLQTTVGVALSDNFVFVADSSTGKVHIFDTRGKLQVTIDGLERPTGLAYDPESEQLYVADTLAHRIVVFDVEGRRLFEFGRRGMGDGEFNYPSHLSLSKDVLLVNDNMNFRMQSFDLRGHHLGTFGEHGDGSGFFSQPKGVASDEQGNVYVAGATIDHIQVFSQEGDFLLAFGGEGEGPGHFVMPAGLAIEDNVIYVADSYNQRIQVFRYVGSD
jgi:DNA-binding beta-propeller fold protein YncE